MLSSGGFTTSLENWKMMQQGTWGMGYGVQQTQF